MLLSQYTVLFNKGNKYYCFSTLTKTIVELNQETYNMLSSSNSSVEASNLIVRYGPVLLALTKAKPSS